MPTYDKYDPISGGFRARLNVALTLSAGGFFGAMSLNASGRAIAGNSGQSGIVGVCVKNVARGPVGQYGTTLNGGIVNPNAPISVVAGSVIDIMTAGEIVGLDKAIYVAGTKFYAQPDGTITAVAGIGKVLIGWTVEAGRLIVRVAASVAPLTA